MEKDMIFHKLEMHWHRTIGWMNTDNRGRAKKEAIHTSRVFKMLMEKYGEPHRSRHGYVHILEMLNEYQKIDGEDYRIMLGIWFHDAIWEPCSKTNEEDSVVFMRECMGLMASDKWEMEEIENLILATKHDKIESVFNCKLIADLDLFCLGKEKEDFNRDRNLIRKEYRRVDDHIFIKGTSDFFKNLLAVKGGKIFYTPYFKERYESKAKRNVLSLVK